MNWKQGLILSIKDCEFDDGNTRDKYTIVLYVNQVQVFLIHCLTTSQNPFCVVGEKFGCCVHNYTMPYFCIPAMQEIGDEKFFFEKDTFIFFMNNVRKEAIAILEMANKKIFGLVSLGILSDYDLKRLIKCALKSKFLTSEVVRLLKSAKSLE